MTYVLRQFMLAAVALSILLPTNAQAKRYHHRHYQQHISDTRPARWCGWWMRRQVPRDPGREFNLARRWASYGRAAHAQLGAIVVWISHVGKITGPCRGHICIVTSGNDGHAVRTRARSISGAIAFRA